MNNEDVGVLYLISPSGSVGHLVIVSHLQRQLT